MFFRYCKNKISNSSNFSVISACSNFSTSFRKFISGLQTDDGCDALFFFVLLNCDVTSSLDFMLILCSFNPVYLMSFSYQSVYSSLELHNIFIQESNIFVA